MRIRSGLPAGVLISFALVVAGCAGDPPEQTSTREAVSGEPAVVAYVNDGDTLRTADGRKIRLVQIDAPELHGDCYGKAALVALRRLVPAGTRITLARDPALDSADRYGRQLRYVFAAGTNVNLALVREGAASPYFFRGVQGRYGPDLLDAVNEARNARRGYWRACPQSELDTGRGSITGPE